MSVHLKQSPENKHTHDTEMMMSSMPKLASVYQKRAAVLIQKIIVISAKIVHPAAEAWNVKSFSSPCPCSCSVALNPDIVTCNFCYVRYLGHEEKIMN